MPRLPGPNIRLTPEISKTGCARIQRRIINADGPGREDLTGSRAYDILPAFSPSGDEIVFSKMTFGAGGERSDLFLMRADGANKRQLTDTPRAFEYEADWQPLIP